MKRFKNYILITIIIFSSNALYAVPGTYYNSIDTNKTCAALKTALFQLLSSNTTTSIPYSLVDDYFDKTDLKAAKSPQTGSVVSDRYSSDNPYGADYCNYRFPTDFCGNRPSGSTECYCYNKEHVFPKSWFGGENVYPMYSDIHFIWPADSYMNFRKGNTPIGYVKNSSYTSHNGTKVGTSETTLNYSYNSSLVFEPIDSFKGDFARAYLYVITRYEDSIINWVGRSTSANVLDGNKYLGLKPWILQLCVKWSKLDPPSAFEIKRNDSVFAIQGNRNPYIDHSNWVEKVFGINGKAQDCVSTAIHKNNTIDFSIFPNPVKDAVLNIQFTNNQTEESIIEIADILGRIVYTQKINAGTSPIIDVSSLDKGIYFLNLLHKDSNSVSTFIKE
jgi:endonuclease I